MKRPTQADVANLAGVSRATVSYVISGRKNGPITTTEETRQRVLRAARELGYEPDATAQSLRLRSNRTIGVLIPDLHNPHYWQILRGAEEAARAHGYDLLLTNTCLDCELERKGVRSLLRRRVDGLVLVLTFGDCLAEELQTLSSRRSPAVLLGAGSDSHTLDSVNPTYRDCADQMMAHLLGLGHRRIGLIYGVARPESAQDRLDAYRQAMTDAGLGVDNDLIVHCGPTMADGYQAAMRLLDQRPRPTAILAINDLLALAAIAAATERGLHIPGDLSVAGFDDIDQAAFSNPPLTTVRGNSEEIGRTALRLIFARLREPERPHEHIRVPATLVKRASTGPAPVG